MLQPICRRFVPAFVAVLALSLSVSADWTLDTLNSSGKNGLGYYWYWYTAGYTPNTAIIPDFTTSFHPTAGGYDGSAYAASMTFNALNSGKDDDYPSIAMGTDITSDGSVGIGSDFSGVTGISFYAKGPAGLKFNFAVQTVENTGTTKNDNAHNKLLTISTANTWQAFTVPFTDLDQEDWGTKYTFDKTKATKIVWMIKLQNNTNATAGTFAVDDVKFIGDFTAPDPGNGGDDEDVGDSTFWQSNFVVPTPSAMFSDFEDDLKLKGKLGYYWYNFTDGGATKENLVRSPGRTGAGDAAFSAFTVPAGAEDPTAVVGVDFYDTTTGYWDASDFTGVYFEYKTTAGVSPVDVELHDAYSTEHPLLGLTFSVKLPGTSGEWKAAAVNFSDFKLPPWATEANQQRNLGVTELAKLHFIYKGAESGSIAVDNVYFLGTGTFDDDPVPVDTVYTLTYIAGDGGTLKIVDEALTKQPTYEVTVKKGSNGPTVTAEADSGYTFTGWSDGFAVIYRTDTAIKDTTFTALFEKDSVVDPPVIDSFTVTYIAGSGGALIIGEGEDAETDSVYTFRGEVGDTVPVKVTAVADSGYIFAGWSPDNYTELSRADTVKSANAAFTALFVEDIPIDSGVVKYLLRYAVEGNGKLLVSDTLRGGTYSIWVEKDSLGPEITAVPDSNFIFVGWSDGGLDTTRADIAADSIPILTALFEEIQTSVASTDRVVPTVPGSEIVVVAPVAVVAGEFTVGPNPVVKQSEGVRFFWSGRAVKSGKLSIFDASGNLVRKVNVSGKSAGAIGSWDLKDAKGGPVAEGTYLVKGAIVTQDGKKVKASAVVGVR